MMPLATMLVTMAGYFLSVASLLSKPRPMTPVGLTDLSANPSCCFLMAMPSIVTVSLK